MSFFVFLLARGIAEPIKLLLQDSGVSHDYNRLDFEEWSKEKAELNKKKTTFDTLPFVELDGKHLNGTAPILRLLSKKLGGTYYTLLFFQ